jgi:hypothetical protein
MVEGRARGINTSEFAVAIYAGEADDCATTIVLDGAALLVAAVRIRLAIGRDTDAERLYRQEAVLVTCPDARGAHADFSVVAVRVLFAAVGLITFDTGTVASVRLEGVTHDIEIGVEAVAMGGSIDRQRVQALFGAHPVNALVGAGYEPTRIGPGSGAQYFAKRVGLRLECHKLLRLER